MKVHLVRAEILLSLNEDPVPKSITIFKRNVKSFAFQF